MPSSSATAAIPPRSCGMSAGLMGNPASNTDYPRYGSLCSIRSACLIHKSCHPCHQCASSALAVHRGRWRLCTLPSSSSRRRSTTAEAGANHVVAYALASPGSAKAKAPHCGAFCDISWRRGGLRADVLRVVPFGTKNTPQTLVGWAFRKSCCLALFHCVSVGCEFDCG